MILKRLSFQRDTGLKDDESYQDYLMRARPPNATEQDEMRALGMDSFYEYRKNKKDEPHES